MTVQEKINRLNQYQLLNREIDRELEKLSRWRSRAERITPAPSEVPGGGSEDRIQTAIEKICEIEIQINDKIDQLLSLRQEIELAIDAVTDPRYREVLRRRYIDGCTWEKIAVDMEYTYQWICSMHGRAIKQLIVIDTPSVL